MYLNLPLEEKDTPVDQCLINFLSEEILDGGD